MATTRVVRFPSKLGDDYSTVMANFYIVAMIVLGKRIQLKRKQ